MQPETRQYFNELAAGWEDTVAPEREASLAEILAALKLEGGHSLLDVGCGTGALVPYLTRPEHKPKKLVSLDPAEKMLYELNRRHGPKTYPVCGPGENLPFGPAVFDRVICFSVFPHFSQPETVLAEIHRVLNKHGLGAIAHLDSSQVLNQMHSSLEGAVADDSLPPVEEVKKLVSESNLQGRKFIEREGLYLALFEKNE